MVCEGEGVYAENNEHILCSCRQQCALTPVCSHFPLLTFPLKKKKQEQSDNSSLKLLAAEEISWKLQRDLDSIKAPFYFQSIVF